MNADSENTHGFSPHATIPQTEQHHVTTLGLHETPPKGAEYLCGHTVPSQACVGPTGTSTLRFRRAVSFQTSMHLYSGTRFMTRAFVANTPTLFKKK
jgi:hypothetical protein